ncbi:hypothetical protein [Loigolactobacillus bifermentans]|jgi:hypothetical protein|uniref:Uncharacterized protein n=1 Tax=Loigolactobacillus bifermentans DSM 20003 TaxID=1423726 RepID=A0A0R1H0K1_9LACO|nr:hypothetical protein [Loigolactobacillus bifermentans]KRK40157.1 hypothetical protein FC07_GL001359 [Loigolactobacillus bifermentans DSM 20003]QGG60902.1 hypothetical protein LB003_10740 [Loigolactobacillus bifermentans]
MLQKCLFWGETVMEYLVLLLLGLLLYRPAAFSTLLFVLLGISVISSFALEFYDHFRQSKTALVQ